ncbi:hypothetical protein [Pseudophaeobacter leonis]|uniref:hypothetical protein n=1 Tax=Pseudophaeobacter leonis TaxID=1144477 RepID=UPI00111BE4AF|nr:hypothetical protein [Pseudophaeobacter leonis]
MNADGPAEPPKRRPCLVLDDFDLNGSKFGERAYGTSSRNKTNTGYKVRVCSFTLASKAKPPAFAWCGEVLT